MKLKGFILFFILLSVISIHSNKIQPKFHMIADMHSQPFFYEFKYNMYSTGIQGSLMGSVKLNNFIIGLESECSYLSFDGQNENELLQGAFFDLKFRLNGIHYITKWFHIRWGIGGLWNQSAFNYNNTGWISLTKGGLSFLLNFRFLPPTRYIDFEICNQVDLIDIFNFEGEYSINPVYKGGLRFNFHPVVKWMSIYVEAGGILWFYNNDEIDNIISGMVIGTAGISFDICFQEEAARMKNIKINLAAEKEAFLQKKEERIAKREEMQRIKEQELTFKEEKRLKEEAEKKKLEELKKEEELAKLKEQKKLKEEAEKKKLEEQKKKEEIAKLKKEKKLNEEAEKKRLEEQKEKEKIAKLDKEKKLKEEAEKKRLEEQKEKERIAKLEEKKKLEELKKKEEIAKLKNEKKIKKETEKKKLNNIKKKDELTKIENNKNENTNISINLNDPLYKSFSKADIGDKLKIKKIYFKEKSPVIMTKSYEQLNKIAVYMNSNKEIFIAVGAYSESIGNPISESELILNRAIKIKSYLKTQGIEESRIEVKRSGKVYFANNNIDPEIVIEIIKM